MLQDTERAHQLPQLWFTFTRIRGSWLDLWRLLHFYLALVLKVHSLVQQRVCRLPQPPKLFICAPVHHNSLVVQFPLRLRLLKKNKKLLITVLLSWDAALQSGKWASKKKILKTFLTKHENDKRPYLKYISKREFFEVRTVNEAFQITLMHMIVLNCINSWTTVRKCM